MGTASGMDDNVKKVYVINLDRKRIMILSGVVLIVAGAAFWAGKMVARPGYTPYEDFNSIIQSDNKPVDEPIALEHVERPEIVMADSESDNLLRVEKDPFLESPGSTNNPQTSVVQQSKTEAPKAEGTRYYTIQLGAYKREADAIRFVKELKEKGVDARVDRGIMYYFVRAGKSKDKSVIEPLYKKIHDNLKLEAIVVYRTIS